MALHRSHGERADAGLRGLEGERVVAEVLCLELRLSWEEPPRGGRRLSKFASAQFWAAQVHAGVAGVASHLSHTRHGEGRPQPVKGQLM